MNSREPAGSHRLAIGVPSREGRAKELDSVPHDSRPDHREEEEGRRVAAAPRSDDPRNHGTTGSVEIDSCRRIAGSQSCDFLYRFDNASISEIRRDATTETLTLLFERLTLVFVTFDATGRVTGQQTFTIDLTKK